MYKYEKIFLLFLGAYTPVTVEGNIIVDGILASCYTISDHDLAHLAMTPIRWFPKITDWNFGENNGTPGYVGIAESLGRWVMPNGQLY